LLALLPGAQGAWRIGCVPLPARQRVLHGELILPQYQDVDVSVVHAAKLATDISAAIVSGWLMWHRRVPAALAAGFVPAAIASALLTRRDLSALADTRRGRYVLAHMPPAAQALRMAGQVVVWRAEYKHRPAGIVAGHALVAVGWSHGLLARAGAS
jgi:hypothetical protein